MPDPITPTRIIPAGAPMPNGVPLPAAPAPPPLYPPAPPPGHEWWRPPTPPPPPAVPPPLDIHIHIDPSAWLPVAPEPEPGPSWWARCRPGYNAACILVGLPLTSGWAGVLMDVRDEASLAGAWVMATIPLAVVAVADNIYRSAARSHPDLWVPRGRAVVARVLLWATVLGAATALPVATIVYAITGVPS